MTTLSPRQATIVSGWLNERHPDGMRWTPCQVMNSFAALDQALNCGLVVYSGDGFYYHRPHPNGNLVCHDQSKLTGTYFDQLLTVWGEAQLVDVAEILDGEYSPTEVAEALECNGYAPEQPRHVY